MGPSGKRMSVLHEGTKCTRKRHNRNCALHRKGWMFQACRSAGAVVKAGAKIRETRASKIKRAPKRRKR
jgi:hypothetical protein